MKGLESASTTGSGSHGICDEGERVVSGCSKDMRIKRCKQLVLWSNGHDSRGAYGVKGIRFLRSV